MLADSTPGILRLSLDTKAAIKVGPFSRGGYNRYGLRAWDHDFEPDTTLKLFGVSIPATDETFFYFSESRVTPDFMVDSLYLGSQYGQWTGKQQSKKPIHEANI